MYLMETVDDLYNHIATVVLFAPDNFPYRDYLADDEQMTLDSAFVELRMGVEIAYPDDKWAGKKKELYALLDKSYAAFKEGSGKLARQLLYDFQNIIFKT